jgi:transcriptional regulator with XRE-family HTH domain
MIMTPFGIELARLLRARQVRQQDLATALGVHPTYLSALAHGRKGVPGKHITERIAVILELPQAEVDLLERAARDSYKQLELPLTASRDERRVAARLIEHMGRLLPDQLQAIESVLALTPAHSKTSYPGKLNVPESRSATLRR